jgi:hypothetical protein
MTLDEAIAVLDERGFRLLSDLIVKQHTATRSILVRVGLECEASRLASTLLER